MTSQQQHGRDWRSQAACRDAEAELFFPTAEIGPIYDAQVAAAKAVCASCPVRPDCLDEALLRIPYGIAGGLTPEERRGLTPARRRTVAGSGTSTAASRTEAVEQGLALLAAGRSARVVARLCGVTERTVTRWAARARAHQSGVSV